MKKIHIIILLFVGTNLFAQDIVPFKNEIFFKVKGEKYDFFINNDNYHLVTENPVSGKFFLNSINIKTGEVIERKVIDYLVKEDSIRFINDSGRVAYSEIPEIKIVNNLKFRMDFERSIYLENHDLSKFKKYNFISELPGLFKGKTDGFIGINSVFSDSIYYSSNIKIEINKFDVVNFIYDEPNHFVVVNKIDRVIASNGNDMYNTVDCSVYHTNKNGEKIWQVDTHEELSEKKIRVELESGGKGLFEYIFYKGKLILFYHLYITVYDVKTGKYTYLETKKGPHWKCDYKKIDNKIYEYSNKEIREIDLDKLIITYNE